MNKYNIQRIELLKKSHYDFPDNWDNKSIKEAINSSKNELPKFNLSKIEIHPSGLCNQNCKIWAFLYLVHHTFFK